MYKINIVCTGSLKEQYFKEAQEEYLKRLSRFCDVKVTEFGETRLSSSPTPSEIATALDKEYDIISSHLKGKVFVLSLEGKQYDSEAFCKKLFDSFSISDTITFVIGSSYGLSQKLKEKYDNICFSKMTFPHHLVRIFLEEQIYRAFTIKNNISYHK